MKHLKFFKGFVFALIIIAIILIISAPVWAALQSRFDVITFKPAVDGGNYYTVYGSQNLKAMQGNIGVYFDYSNRPLQFVGTGAAVGRQSIIDHLFIADLYGAFGITDWFEVGVNIPSVIYNWFFTDNAAALEDHGGGMGDMMIMMKFRIINTENSPVGFAAMPVVTLPTGDIVRYMGSGSVTGGLMLITDFVVHERFTLALNLGGVIRDDVTRHGVRVDDQFVYGLGAQVDLGKGFHAIAEAFGRTTMRNFFQNTSETPFEAGGGIRYLFGDTGFSVDAGATAGIIEGVGSPRVRGFVGLKWTAPVKECIIAPPPPPDPRIRGDRIVIWGKIFFDTDKATIKPISYPVLNDVVDVLRRNPELTLVEVQGHCDIRGGDAYNMKLSQRRAESAREYLISKGIDSSRLTAKGYGYRKPIADNKTKEGMSQNRRTEFVILKQGFAPAGQPVPVEPNLDTSIE